MRLLVDECIDERLRLLFPGHECESARFAGLAGLKNGRLLEAAEEGGFDVLITGPEHSGATEPKRTEDCPGDSLWTDQPSSRFGAVGTRGDFRDRFDPARRCRENSIAALGSSETSTRLEVSGPLLDAGHRVAAWISERRPRITRRSSPPTVQPAWTAASSGSTAAGETHTAGAEGPLRRRTATATTGQQCAGTRSSG